WQYMIMTILYCYANKEREGGGAKFLLPAELGYFLP
ncbi:unnamed protein product, partial [marine sediment metagenome]